MFTVSKGTAWRPNALDVELDLPLYSFLINRSKLPRICSLFCSSAGVGDNSSARRKMTKFSQITLTIKDNQAVKTNKHANIQHTNELTTQPNLVLR